MAQIILVFIIRAKSMIKVDIAGQMDHIMKENGSRTKFMEEELISGQTGENTSVNGKTIAWMVSVSTHGRTVENMKVSIKETKNMEKESIPGQTVENMTVNGQMDFSMAKAATSQSQASQEKVFGSTVREKNGWTKNDYNFAKIA